VARLTKFGAFVTLIPGVDGLIHISKLGRGKRITHPSEILTEGEIVAVKIEKIERESKRISLAPLGDAEEEKAEEIEDFQKYVGKAPGSFGSLGDALQKKMGAKTS
jgi:small subunit ribosomal protein S1